MTEAVIIQKPVQTGLHHERVNKTCNFQHLIFNNTYSQKQPSRGVLKICSKFTGEHPYRSAISIKLQSKFIEITLWHRCSPVNLLHIFRTPFLKSTSGRLFLDSGCLNSFCYFLKVH